MLRCWFSTHKPSRRGGGAGVQTQTASGSTLPLGSRCARVNQPGGWVRMLFKMQAKSPLCRKERPELSACSPRPQADASAAPQRPTGVGPGACLYLERSSGHSAAAAAAALAEAAAAALSGRRRTLAAKGKRPGGAAGTTGAAAGGSSSTERRADSEQPRFPLLSPLA